MAAEHSDLAGRAGAGILADRPMTAAQVGAVSLSVALNALDGFDVLAMTFAAPGVAAAWNIGPAQLGVVLSSGLVGMALGSLMLAPFGDRYGRRPLVLGCLVVMALGMAMTATATGIATLCLWRLVTGLGIGGLVAAINAVAAEFSSERRRDFSVAMMTIGYPVGGLVGGLFVAQFVPTAQWHLIFLGGALATAAFIPLVWLFLPESLDYLASRNSPDADGRINAVLRQMGHSALEGAELDALRRVQAKPTGKGSIAMLLSDRFRLITLLMICAYFLHIVTFYFFSGWLPKLMSDAGHSVPDAIRTSAIMNLGGGLGGAMLGLLAPRFGLIRLVALSMVATTVTFSLFAVTSSLPMLQLLCFAAGFAMFGGIVGLFALLARAFPPELRVTGTGLAIGFGRGGAVVGPIAGGLLLASGASPATSVAIMGTSALGAAALILVLGARMHLRARSANLQ